MATERYRKKVLRSVLDGKPRSVLAAMAAIAETAERYDDMLEAVKRLPGAESGPLTVEERNLYSVAYKNLVGALRTSWRAVSSICEKEAKASAEDWQLEETRRFREKVEAELHDLCSELLDQVKTMVDGSTTGAPPTESEEGCVFFRKMAGDYYRYLAEVQTGDNRSKLAAQAQEQYETALKMASETLPPTHPITLGLHLNFSVFLYEIGNAPARACRLAKRGFTAALPSLNELADEAYNDSFVILQLIRDNLTLWTSDIQMPEASSSPQRASLGGEGARGGDSGSADDDGAAHD